MAGIPEKEAMHQVAFQPVGRRVAVTAGTTLLEAGRAAGLVLSANCGGIGVCGRCRVSVLSGEMEPPMSEELSCLSDDEVAAGERLACRARIQSDVAIHVPPSFLNGGQRLQLEADESALQCEPLIERLQLAIEAPLCAGGSGDGAGIARALSSRLGDRGWYAGPPVTAQLERLTRRAGQGLTAYLRGHEVLGFSEPERPAAGLAVDLGCTKIAGYLLDLHTGRQLAAEGVSNPQISFGEDLISRLVFAARGAEEAARLAGCVREAIGTLVRRLCTTAGVHNHEVVDACIVGNTAMTHLLLGLPVAQLLRAPFIAAVESDLDVAATELGLPLAPGAGIHVPPGIGGFVGADHVAMILARSIDRASSTTIGIDIGTNTEIVLAKPSEGLMMVASVPSGPALEGGHIHDGMRAGVGAIEKITMTRGTLRFETIGGGAPIGLCGSGVIDLVARLWQAGLLNERGQLLADGERVREGRQGREFVVVGANESGHGRELVFTQKDIGEVQLAKAAIRAGIQSLLEITHTADEEVGELVVAGAFGSHLDLESAVAIGVLPRLLNARYLQVGNAAGAGAKMALVSAAARERAREIARRARRIELKSYEHFNRLLARATRFPKPIGAAAREEKADLGK